jgi:succinate dehydrogenase / fumarate reductase flavoprotein subunit
LNDLGERVHKCNLLDDSGWANQAVPFTRAMVNMIEQSKAIVGGAIVRDESRGAHFKMDTPQRDDKDWLKTTKATWTPAGPTFEFEPIDVRYIPPRARKYRINQNIIVKEIMGEDFLKGVGEQGKSEPAASPTS